MIKIAKAFILFFLWMIGIIWTAAYVIKILPDSMSWMSMPILFTSIIVILAPMLLFLCTSED